MLGTRKKQWLLGFGLLLVVATLLGRAAFDARGREGETEAAQAAQRRAGQAWANLWQCALGGEVPDVEIPARARRIALAAEAPSWPASCSEHITKLFARITEASHPALRAALRERFECDTTCRIHDPGRQMVNLSPLGDGLPAVPPEIPAPPMAPPPAVTKTSLRVIAPADAEVVRRDVDAGRLELNSPRQGRFVCSLEVDTKKATCTKLGEEVPPEAVLVARSDRMLLVEGKKTYAPDGTAVTTHVGRVEGQTLFLQGKRDDERRWEVAQVMQGKAERVARVTLPATSRPWLVDGQLGWIDDAGRVERRPLTSEGELLGDREFVGSLGEDTRAVPRRCATDEGHALIFGLPPRVAMSWTDGGLTEPIAFAATPTEPPPAPSARPTSTAAPATATAKDFGMAGLLEGAEVDDRPWGAPEPVESSPLYAKKDGMRTRATRAHRASPRPHRGRVAFGCTTKTATIYWRQPRVGDTELHRITCARGGACEEAISTLNGVDPQSWWWVGPVGSKVIAIWRAPDGLVRMRHGDFDALTESESVILLDSEDFGGPKTLGVEVFPGRRGVAFWFRSAEGTHAIVVDETGQVASLGG